MSLFSAIQSSANALRVSQLGLQVVGSNISNVNTPGYIRQEMIQTPGGGYRYGDLVLGQGVEVAGIQQQVDKFLLERMRQTQSQLSYHQALDGTNANIESFLNELTSNDLSTKMSDLANAFQEVANLPGNESMRSLALLRGQELATQLRTVSENVVNATANSQSELNGTVSEINQLTQSIAKLNLRIVELESGSNSDAVGLRDERYIALDKLSSLIDITTSERPNGSVTVFVGGDYIVADAIPREVKVATSPSGDGTREIRFVDTDSKLSISGGKVRGLYEAANMATQSGFITRLDDFAKSVINVVNRIHSQGQGSQGYENLTSEVAIQRTNVPLEVSNPEFQIDNGSFEIRISDASTNETKTIEVPIKQQGLSTDTTADQLVSFLNSIDGLNASINDEGKLQLDSESQAITFSFGNDSSGALAALGINTFYVGNSASTIAVRSDLAKNPSLLAVSSDGVGNGTGNAVKLAEAFVNPSSQLGGKTLNSIYDALITDTTQEINAQKGVSDGLSNFYKSLEAKHLGISGVNLDEEAVKMMLYQRSFQAQSRLVSVASELLETLVNII